MQIKKQSSLVMAGLALVLTFLQVRNFFSFSETTPYTSKGLRRNQVEEDQTDFADAIIDSASTTNNSADSQIMKGIAEEKQETLQEEVKNGVESTVTESEEAVQEKEKEELSMVTEDQGTNDKESNSKDNEKADVVTSKETLSKQDLIKADTVKEQDAPAEGHYQKQQQSNEDKLQAIAPMKPDIPTETQNQKSMRNLHENFPMKCGTSPTELHPAIEPLTDLYWNDLETTPGYHKSMYLEGQGAHGLSGLGSVVKTQVCLYDILARWNDLTKKLNMTRWAVHGGSAISAQCYGAINPWDDDIDLTVTNCSALNDLYDHHSQDVYEVYPDIDPKHISLNRTFAPKWFPRLIEGDLVLVKGHGLTPWYKLMTVEQARIPSRNIMGMDIECMERTQSKREIVPKQRAGWTQYLKSDKPLDVVMYGPTTIQMLPAQIHQDYVKFRYNKESPCRYPFHHGQPPEPFAPPSLQRSSQRHGDEVYLPDIRTASMDAAISKWYIPKSLRQEWMEKAGDGNHLNYTQQIPNLDHVEIDNAISPEGCDWKSHQNSIKVIGWNAERGKTWDKLVSFIRDMEELQEPYVLLLNEMDIGMARSGNIHTARRLAHQLGMNYAWSLEFVELTRGNKQEQNVTEGMRDALGLHGNAILSKCILGDAMVLRDPLDAGYFADHPVRGGLNADGYEKRLGGRNGVFARIYQTMPNHFNLHYEDGTSRMPPAEQEPHFVVGNVHKINDKSSRNREALWKYFSFGNPPQSESLLDGVGENPGNQLGVVMQGDFAKSVCNLAGLNPMSTPGIKLKTFPVKSCTPGSVYVGPIMSDFFCSNMESKRDPIVTPPCWYSKDMPPLTMADHAIVSMELQGKDFYTT